MKSSFINLQVFVCLILFVIFSYLFGYPALVTYMDKAVMIKTSKDKFKPLLDSPAVTICVDVSHNFKEKVDSRDYFNIELLVDKLCPLATSANDVSDCFNRKIYNRSELIEGVLLGENVTQNLWTSHITLLSFGKCHTMINPRLLGVRGYCT